MAQDDYFLQEELDGSLTVVLGREKRPPSPEPPSSPCPNQHHITPLGEKEGLQGREGKVAVVRAVHNCTPLNAAVIMNDVEKLRSVLQNGISLEELNQPDCTGSPPICEAAYHNRFSAMQLILDYPGVNVNIGNYLGFTPLCIAAGNTLDNPKMTELLLDKNADVNVRAKDGRSPLHIAAEGGNYRIIRRLLEAKDLKEEYVTDVYQDGGIYCPPPVILAAAHQHENIVNQLLQRTPHPDLVVKDVYLLHWARKTLIAAVAGRSTFDDQKLIAALNIVESQSEIVYRPPIAAYDNLQEISSFNELEAYSNMEKNNEMCVRIFQSLIIMERTLGLSNKLVSTCIGQAINALKHINKFEEVVKLLARIFEGLSLMERLVLTRGFSMMPTHLHVALSFFLVVQFWKRIRELTKANFEINFLPFVIGLVSDLDTILNLKDKQPCRDVDHWGEAFQTDFTHLFAMIACALHASKKHNSVIDRNRLQELGLEIVSKYKSYADENFTSLVHLALRKATGIVDILKCSGMGGRNAINSYIQLIEALLHWGCASVLNSPYKQYFCEGELPLHMAVRLAEMDPCYLSLVNILLFHGAHYDGVSSSGVTPSTIATRIPLLACFDLSPLPLACLTSKAILQHRIVYKSSPYLPPVLKRFISYHDSTHCQQREYDIGFLRS